ncbi:nucleotide-binding domain-containing protein [Clostridium perfringens]|uniref:nucleotide-binding domain-containing protein n=1 Tax=Clostridium perfringens TaxID=1502 RepID=UPI0039EBB479
MSLENDFKEFIEKLEPTNIEEMKITVGEIAKKLNCSYYGVNGDKESNIYIVGSIGRTTAINGVSDLDIIFDLPKSIYEKFNSYNSNGQSALLQEVKNILKERYSNTDISGDGQVVVIEFSKYTVELVPGFKQNDNSFKYPDTHDGGSWKITNPLKEIDESIATAEGTNNNFIYIANMLRAWKNKNGFKFGGLLIDTLTYNFLNDKSEYKDIEFKDYFDVTKELFKYLKELNKEQNYWFALGSNQKVYNCDNGKFISKAKKAYKKIESLDKEDSGINTKLREIFGSKFPKKNKGEKASSYEQYYSYRDTEEFIEDKVPVDIKYSIKIDCKVTQDGFRKMLLSNILKEYKFLSRKKSLEFFISDLDNDLKNSYDIYWKVKNEGEVAKERDCIRGQVKKYNTDKIKESTDFKGEHYVECYIVQNGICVARDKINVPISN